MSLDVEIENKGAIKVYKKLGYRIIGDIKILELRKTFEFYRMIKEL